MNDSDPDRASDGKGHFDFFRQVLDAAKGLPPFLRFTIVFAVLFVGLILSGKSVQPELVPLLYVVFILGVSGYLLLEFMAWKTANQGGTRSVVPAAESAPVAPTVPPPEQSPPKPQQPPADWREAYCRDLWRRCNRLQLTTIDRKAASHPEAAELELSEVYTSLDVAGAEMPEDGERHEMAGMGEGRHDRRPATAAVCQWDKLVLLGDPGSGKSTLASFIALCLAGDYLGDVGVDRSNLGDDWTLPRLLPLPVVLREYVAHGLMSGVAIWDFVHQQLTRSVGAGCEPAAVAAPLQETLKSGEGGLLILDGLDEVPEANQTRERLRDQVMAFCDDFRHCRVLVTARPYAYQDERWRLPGFDVKRLADFSDEQIESFIARWYDHVAAKDPSLNMSDAKLYADQLKSAIKSIPRLGELASRPLLLTLMASLHRWRGGGALPEKRQELYEESVKLLIDLWQRPKFKFDAQGQPIETEYDVFRELGIPQDNLRQALERVAYEVHRDQKTPTGAANIRVGKLAEAFVEAAPQESRSQILIEQVTTYVTDRAGLLIERSPQEEYAFPHRTFQEYLAACHLTNDNYPFTLRDRLREDDERWREVALLAAAKAASGTASSIRGLVEASCPADWNDAEPPDEPECYTSLRAAQALIETEHYLNPPEQEAARYERLRTWIERICTRGMLPAPDRAAAGRVLATLGDRRAGVGVIRQISADPKSELPDIRWCDVPGGTLMLGTAADDPDASNSESGPDGKPFPVEISDFRLSAYPVTNAQFRPFVEGDGYDNPDYWKGLNAKESDWTEPRLWCDAEWNSDNQPVVGVSWYEAVAYCRWLTDRLREQGLLEEARQIRLPTEAEWEWSARGPGGTKYPWSNQWRENACNSEESGIGKSCAVGLFPDGRRRWLKERDELVYDLAGNVWEWCATKWRESYGEPAEDSLEGDAIRCMRGGAYWNDKASVRGSCRYWYFPVYRGTTTSVFVSPSNSPCFRFLSSESCLLTSSVAEGGARRDFGSKDSLVPQNSVGPNHS